MALPPPFRLGLAPTFARRNSWQQDSAGPRDTKVEFRTAHPARGTHQQKQGLSREVVTSAPSLRLYTPKERERERKRESAVAGDKEIQSKSGRGQEGVSSVRIMGCKNKNKKMTLTGETWTRFSSMTPRQLTCTAPKWHRGTKPLGIRIPLEKGDECPENSVPVTTGTYRLFGAKKSRYRRRPSPARPVSRAWAQDTAVVAPAYVDTLRRDTQSVTTWATACRSLHRVWS